METKFCNACQKNHPATLEFFPPSKVTKSGLSSYCRPCQYKKNEDWRKRNRDKARECARKWREKNAEKEYFRLAMARVLNPERQRARVRKSYYKNHAKRLAARRRYFLAHREKERAYGREYSKTHPCPIAQKEKSARKRAKAQGVTIDQVDYEKILASNGMICHICKATIQRKDLVFDHVIPMCKGGPHNESNILPAHYECNRKKGKKI
jgi:5-methylcytosine-specific restriction endonuclease McrA